MEIWVDLRKIGTVVQTIWLGHNKYQDILDTLRDWSARIYFQILMGIAHVKLLVKSIQLVIMFHQNKDLSHKIQVNLKQKISDDSVSQIIINLNYSFSLILFVSILLVERPTMVPRKDYDDYAKFINDSMT